MKSFVLPFSCLPSADARRDWRKVMSRATAPQETIGNIRGVSRLEHNARSRSRSALLPLRAASPVATRGTMRKYLCEGIQGGDAVRTYVGDLGQLLLEHEFQI